MNNTIRYKLHVRKGDLVKVITGDDKGKTGKVLQIIRKTSKIIVKNVNIKTKHLQPKKQANTGKLLTFEAPIHSSNVIIYNRSTSNNIASP